MPQTENKKNCSCHTIIFARDLQSKTINNLLHNLKVICSLENGQKLWLNDELLTVDNTYFQPLTRRMFGQSRNTIVPFVIHTIMLSIDYKLYKDIRDHLIICDDGINVLIESYPKKMELNQLITNINQHLLTDIGNNWQ